MEVVCKKLKTATASTGAEDQEVELTWVMTEYGYISVSKQLHVWWPAVVAVSNLIAYI